MNPAALPPGRRRALALAILAVVVVGLGAALIWPFLNRFEHYSQALEQLEFRLRRFAAVAASQAPLQAQVEALRQRWQAQGYLLARDTPALASADLQQLVSQAVASHGGQLLSTQVLAPQPEAGFVRIGIKVRMTGNVEALRGVLHALETDRIPLLVDNLQVQRSRARPRRRSRDEPEVEPEVLLDVDFELAGYMRAAGS